MEQSRRALFAALWGARRSPGLCSMYNARLSPRAGTHAQPLSLSGLCGSSKLWCALSDPGRPNTPAGNAGAFSHFARSRRSSMFTHMSTFIPRQPMLSGVGGHSPGMRRASWDGSRWTRGQLTDRGSYVRGMTDRCGGLHESPPRGVRARTPTGIAGGETRNVHRRIGGLLSLGLGLGTTQRERKE